MKRSVQVTPYPQKRVWTATGRTFSSGWRILAASIPMFALSGLGQPQDIPGPKLDGSVVVLNTGDNIANAVKSNPEGTVFSLKPVVYRLQSITPKHGDTFIAEPGAVLNGAQLLGNFRQQGQYWVA